jgi:hypothetical protein
MSLLLKRAARNGTVDNPPFHESVVVYSIIFDEIISIMETCSGAIPLGLIVVVESAINSATRNPLQ